MGLRSNLRRWLVSRGHKVPGFLIREHDRLFHETVNSVRRGMVVLDIGANRGEVAAAFAARGAVVHAFEPNPDIYPELERASLEYPLIRPQNCGILDEDTEMKLYLHTDYEDDLLEHSESSSLLTNKPNVSEGNFHVVPVRDIAKVIAEIGHIDIAKIDVEGAEYRILSRMITTGVYENVATTFVETHHDRIESLKPEYENVLELIARSGIEDRFRFDWV